LPFIPGVVVITIQTATLSGAGGWLDFVMQHFLAVTALLWLHQKRRARGIVGRIAATDGGGHAPGWSTPLSRPVARSATDDIDASILQNKNI
jgi:hypothetical protein